MGNMRVEKVDLNKINVADYNPRIMLKKGDRMYDALEKSVDEFGLVIPLIINERTNTLVSGHQRLSILKDKGIEKADVIYIDLPENKEKSLCIALNKIDGEWEYGKLSDILLEIGGDLAEGIGFSKVEISELLGELQEEMDDQEFIPIETLEKVDPARNGKIKVTIGEYYFNITESEYENLVADLHECVGWSKEKIAEEVKRRLTNA